MRSRAAIGRRNRQRGQEGEREFCARLSDAFGKMIRRALGQERDQGTDVVDLPPYRIEVKRRKRIAGLYDWMNQADEACIYPNGRLPGQYLLTPVVALRADGKDWLVVMRLDDWTKVIREEIK